MKIRSFVALAGVAVASSFASAQVLSDQAVGTIVGSGIGSGDTLTADNVFNGRFGLWTGTGVYGGGDEVWIIDHNGGMLDITVEFSDSTADLDLFLYDMDITPTQADVVDLSLGFSTTESVGGDFAAGRYYLLVDSFVGSGGQTPGSAYSITVVPTPGVLGLAAMGGLVAVRRRR